MSYRPERHTRTQAKTMALLRVSAAAEILTDLANPPFGFTIAVGVAREAGCTDEQIAALTPYTAPELEEMF